MKALTSRRAPGPVALVLILGSLTALGPLSVDMYLPSFPAIAAALAVDVSQVQYTLAAFFVGLSVGQLCSGPLTDRLGRTRPVFGGLALYVAGTLACANATSIELLVVGRFVQAMGGAVGLVVSRAVVRDLYSGVEAARMLSRLVLVMGIAPILAPLLGGLILTHWGWRAIFWVIAAFGAALLVAAIWRLPETAPRIQHREEALVTQYLTVLRSRAFISHTATVAFSQAGMFAYIAGAPFVFMSLYGVPPTQFGWFFGANAAGFILASQVNHTLLATFPPARVLGAALWFALCAAAGVVVFALTGIGGVRTLFGCLFLFISSLGFIGPNAIAAALEPHRANAGIASSLLGTVQFVVAAAASFAVSALHDRTAVPMAAVLFTAIALSRAAYSFARGASTALSAPHVATASSARPGPK